MANTQVLDSVTAQLMDEQDRDMALVERMIAAEKRAAAAKVRRATQARNKRARDKAAKLAEPKEVGKVLVRTKNGPKVVPVTVKAVPASVRAKRLAGEAKSKASTKAERRRAFRAIGNMTRQGNFDGAIELAESFGWMHVATTVRAKQAEFEAAFAIALRSVRRGR